MSYAFTARQLGAPQYAMNPASRVFPPAPGEAVRAQPTARRRAIEAPVVILNADWRPTDRLASAAICNSDQEETCA